MQLIESDAEQVRSDWRDNQDALMRRRRGIVGLSIFSLGAMAAIALYQTGIFKRPPEPKWQVFLGNSRKTGPALSAPPEDGRVPVLFGGVHPRPLRFAGGRDRTRALPLIPIATGIKALGDAVMAGKLAWNEKSKFKAYCLICLLVSGATMANVALALPEAWEAMRQLTREPRGNI